MPFPGSPPRDDPYPFNSDAGMNSFGLNHEFDYFEDDNTQQHSGVGLFDLSQSDTFDPSNFIDTKALFSGPHEDEINARSKGSFHISHRGSSSSSSSRRTADSTSPKTSRSSVDEMMADGPLSSWKMDDGAINGGLNPMMFSSVDSNAIMDMSEARDSREMNDIFDFESASNSTAQSPENNFSTSLPRAPAAKRIKGHQKGPSQQSLNQSMNRLRTSNSREVSPASNLALSQESSPAAMFTNTNTPSPDSHPNFFQGAPMNVTVNAGWPSLNTMPVNVARSNSTVMRAQNHGLPIYSPPKGPSPGQPQPRLVVHPTPLKSRVETQIPIKLTMHHLPQGIKRIHLPTHTISKPKLLAKPQAVRSPDMLELYTMLVCTSAMQDPAKKERAKDRAALQHHDYSRPRPPDDFDDEESKPQNGGEVRICTGCITRERKRAGRKKHKKPEEEELWNRFEHERVIVFNTQEVKEWQAVTPLMADPTGTNMNINVPVGTVQVDAPMRIACYCRHHSEKMGFQVIFTLKDYQDNVVAQSMSSSIMITDDHKTHIPTPVSSGTTSSTAHPPNNTATARPSQPSAPVDGAQADAQMSFRQTQSTSDLQNISHNQTFPFPSLNNSQGPPMPVTQRNGSRQTSPTTTASGPVSKKRKASGSSKVPSGLAMTRLETGHTPPSLPESAAVTAANSPFSPNLNNFGMSADQMFAQGQQQAVNNVSQPFGTGPPTPNSNAAADAIMFPPANRAVSLDNSQVNQLFSAPASAHPSRAPSPNHLQNELQALQHQPMGQSVFNPSMAMNRMPPPTILRVIPNEGPKCGGVEITILGRNFTNGGLEVMFGDQRATTTTFWGETSLVCLLPPSPVGGIVPVTIKQPGPTGMTTPFGASQQPQTFRYIDDDEQQLIRTALAVLGNKLGGNNITDVGDIARRIIYGAGSRGGSGSGSGGQAPPGNMNFNSLGFESSEAVETGLIRLLEFIDLDDSGNKARINLRRVSGQTMLHLACSLGMNRLVAGLLSRGANVNIRDKGGFTALHMAVINDHPDIVRRLILQGSDPAMRSLSGLSPSDVARSSDVLRALRQLDSHRRSRSGGSLHSRVNSASSLRSLWDHPSATPSHQGELSSDDARFESSDSDEDSSEDDSAEEGTQWLDMRRPSFPVQHPHVHDPSHHAANVYAGPASPGAAVTAIRERFETQIQQLQHSMAMHFQNLPQFQMPNMPQMPQMPQMPEWSTRPMLPDYQAYLHSAPVMQRIQSLVPNIRGQRPDSADDASARDTDSKWWDLFAAKEAPPAYEDIYPQKEKREGLSDIKTTTAARAAVEWEADQKCSALFDQDNQIAESSHSHHPQEIPAMLQIGRKHHITKEQQENLQRAHAQRLKTGSSDKMLWFVWIPILVFVLGAMIVSAAPSLAAGSAVAFKSVASIIANPRELGVRMNQAVQEIV
ncbi:hypothetical protein F5Y15DRAFT_157741 [Xylariaceae sp. FL0016]|nr:hypothetical protein F5Y15DRAFT_157741 [Xylariaceae sp. FL0016]